MNNGVLYRLAVEAEERVTARLNRRRQAQSEVAARGLAFDANAPDARSVYVAAMAQLGVSPDELGGLTSFDLQRMLKVMPARGSRSRAPSMAFDAAPKNDALAGILKGSSTPLDLSDR
jgi:hypothetical protein